MEFAHIILQFTVFVGSFFNCFAPLEVFVSLHLAFYMLHLSLSLVLWDVISASEWPQNDIDLSNSFFIHHRSLLLFVGNVYLYNFDMYLPSLCSYSIHSLWMFLPFGMNGLLIVGLRFDEVLPPFKQGLGVLFFFSLVVAKPWGVIEHGVGDFWSVPEFDGNPITPPWYPFLNMKSLTEGLTAKQLISGLLEEWLFNLAFAYSTSISVEIIFPCTFL